MREPRNPFRLRRSESIETDAAFLGLFEPGILEIIPTERTWESVHLLRSAAGGGKTSLIRLFTPPSLLTLCSRRVEDRLKELFQRVKELGAVRDNSPCVLGVMLSCGPGYSMLQDLDIEQSRRDRLFFGLLNARIILSVLRGALLLKGFEFPKDLTQLQVSPQANIPPLTGIEFPCSGKQLHDWAVDREARICASLDSLGPLRAESLPGDESLLSLQLIQPNSLSYEGRPIAERVLLMMDDVQKLTGHQRALLVNTVIEARSPVGIWIAERFEALTTQEMLSSGAHQGRDYGETIEIESYWRRQPDKFEKHVMKLADRRVQAAADTDLESFRACLQDTLDGPEWDHRFEDITAQVSARIRDRWSQQTRFNEWISSQQDLDQSPRDKAIAWRTLEILIERDLRKKQRGLFDAEPLDEQELKDQQDASVANAAELFLAREFGLPYYFGPERISRLASLNIQQYLGLAGETFEEAAAAELLRNTTAISPERQHALMKTAAKLVWDAIPKRVAHGRELRQFLDSVGKFAHWYTYRPNAPNESGVTGTAIRMSERALLAQEASTGTRPDYRRLADVIASALSHNLLVAQLDYNCKKERWMVLNLNRLLCVHFDLPLGYGLYKERPLPTLCQWLDRVFVSPSDDGELL